MTTRIQIAKQDIVKTLEAGPHVLKPAELAEVFSENRDSWRLARRMTLKSFEQFMTERTLLKEVRFKFPQRPVTGYVWGDVPLLEVLLGLVDDSYLSHYTAVRLHGLTEQVPKTIYLTREKSSSVAYLAQELNDIKQEAIDAAFRRPPRISHNEVNVNDQRIVFLQGALQDKLGVTEKNTTYDSNRVMLLRYTTLERTLIDAAVRPPYSGGVFEVAKAFVNAKEQDISANAMASMLKRMRLAYPYHQAVGFYLERAGYKQSLVDLFKSQRMDRDFYLTHDMGKTKYIKDWRLHVPEGF